MYDSLYVAWRYVSFNKVKTATLVTCITLIAFLPLALERLLNESERQLMSRAVSTPLLVGAKGSALDLVMSALYFGDGVPEPINMKTVTSIADTNLASPIPIYTRFRARGYPVIGTTLDYFDFRDLKIANGRFLAVLGECVLGATVAERLGIAPGDSLVSSPENPFDLSGVYPLKMKVAGVLQKSYSSDDLAIFVDIKTTWVMQGLGHGHEDLARTKDPTVILNRTDTSVTANAKLRHYTEITEANLDSFHFHGDTTIYPITAVIAVPKDSKSDTLLRGRFVSIKEPLQIVKPDDVIDGLLQNIFRIKNILDAAISVVGLGTILAILLVFSLSLRLRQREIHTIFKLGCSRGTIAKLLGAEIIIIVLMSGLVCGVLVFMASQFSSDLVRMLIIR